MTNNLIAKNITKVRDRIRLASQKSGRAIDDITLLAVSKTRPAGAIREAWNAGITDVGENYLQEALEKMAQLEDLPLCWHFIGPVQSNKTHAIAENFNWVHSVDRLKIARRLSDQRPQSAPPMQLCLQVNINTEASKSGIELAQLPELAAAVNALPRVQLRGLMAIPAADLDLQGQHAAFAQLRQALVKLQDQYPQMDTLSMGMSGDLELAIAEGSTILRIGTDIFGPRGG